MDKDKLEELYKDNIQTNELMEDDDEKLFLSELTASTTKVTKRTKLKQQAGVQALRIAKEKNDPLYKKYKRYNTMRLEIKKKLMDKYSRKGMQYVRKNL